MDEGDHETNLQTETDIIVDGVGYQYCLEQSKGQDPTPISPFTTGRFSPENTYVVRSYNIGNKVFTSGVLDRRIYKYSNVPYKMSMEDAHIKALETMREDYGTEWRELI